MRHLLPEDSAYESVEEIRMAGGRATALSHQLLLLSRTPPIQLKALNLNAVILQVQRMLRSVIGEDIRWDASLSPSLGTVTADIRQIEQILMDLITDAHDSMPTGLHIANRDG
jgi:signal transduction histidine kinase